MKYLVFIFSLFFLVGYSVRFFTTLESGDSAMMAIWSIPTIISLLLILDKR